METIEFKIRLLEENSNGCLIWKWWERDGYPRVRKGKSGYVNVIRHLAAKKFNLDIKDRAWFAKHNCGNNSCVNDEHIYVKYYEIVKITLDKMEKKNE